MKNINVSVLALSISLLFPLAVLAAATPGNPAVDKSKLMQFTANPQPQKPAVSDTKPENTKPDAELDAKNQGSQPNQEDPNKNEKHESIQNTHSAPDGGSVGAIPGFFSSTWASVKSASSTALQSAKDHPWYTAAGVAVVGTALYVIAKNWKQIKKAIVNNPGKTAAALGLGAIALYGYKNNWLGSAAATTEVSKTTIVETVTSAASTTPTTPDQHQLKSTSK